MLPDSLVSITPATTEGEITLNMPLFTPWNFILAESLRQILPLSISQIRTCVLRDQVNCPRSHSYKVAGPDSKPRAK